MHLPDKSRPSGPSARARFLFRRPGVEEMLDRRAELNAILCVPRLKKSVFNQKIADGADVNLDVEHGAAAALPLAATFYFFVAGERHRDRDLKRCAPSRICLGITFGLAGRASGRMDSMGFKLILATAGSSLTDDQGASGACDNPVTTRSMKARRDENRRQTAPANATAATHAPGRTTLQGRGLRLARGCDRRRARARGAQSVRQG
jgi:hypothetical protein